MDTTRVIFRAERAGPFKGYLTAVFPDDPERAGFLSCYAHIGQHCTGSLEWYRATRAATGAEYAPLLAELRSIYETGPYAVRLVIAKRR